MKHAHQIKSVAPGSIAEELELEPGDKILQINGQDIEDVLDYRFYIQNEEIDMVVQKKDGSEVEWEFDKDFYEDLGIEFESGLMSDYRSCTNKCIFCFITRCRRECAIRFILKMMMQDFHFFREIILH